MENNRDNAKKIHVENRVNPSFTKIEDDISFFWSQNSIFKKSIEQRQNSDKYSFVDGPPFVTGTPHYGSLLPSIAKDVIPRYWTMRGKKVLRVWGWDCHGLPIEEKVNKKFGILSSRQLEDEMGVEKYVQECRSWVLSCTNEWKWYITKVGRWVDMDNAYYTMSLNFMESVIWAFKQMYEKGYIYKGKRVSLFSTDTSTPVSNFEVDMDPDNYKEVTDLSVFVKFEIQNNFLPLNIRNKVHSNKVYLLAWTTTPWTLPSNFAIAVNPNHKYVLVRFQNELYILSKARLEYTFSTDQNNIGYTEDKLVKILEEFEGKDLEGVSYVPLYDFFLDKSNENDFKVYMFEGVTDEDGTGVLHVAPAFGEEDYFLGKKYGLSDYPDIDEQGMMLVGEWKGIYLRDACELIAQDLSRKGNLLRSELYNHRLPFYRGNNPLIYMAQDSYFVNIQKIKDRMMELSDEINWVPSHIKNGMWPHVILNSPDWPISRNRYWATIIPIWKNQEDGDEIVIGSIEEMMQYTDQIVKTVDENGKIKYLFEGKVEMDLHRDIADKIVLKKNGKNYYRVPEVLDCWMDSGAAPFAEYHYPFENKDLFEQRMPADYIVEYIGQVRAWFNVLHRVSTLVFDKRCFTNVVVTGNLMGNDGRKMSKSYGNFPDPKFVLENVGGEALRLYLMGSRIMAGEDMSWSDEVLNEQVKNILIPLWNVYRYFTIYADLHEFVPQNDNFITNNILDKWLESYIKKSILDYSDALENYNIPQSVKFIQPTIDALSSWWIRRSRDRFALGDKEALQNLYASLVLIIKGFAPQIVFITEEIYQKIVRYILPNSKESVHLEDYPIIDSSSINYDLLDKMNFVREIVNLGHSIRTKHGIKLKQPLSDLVLVTKSKDLILDEDLLEVIKDELNLKNVEVKENFDTFDSLNYGFSENDLVKVYLNLNIDENLLLEGLYAELKRHIQNLRKEGGFNVSDTLILEYNTQSQIILDLFNKYSEQLISNCKLKEIKFNSELNEIKIMVGNSEVCINLH